MKTVVKEPMVITIERLLIAAGFQLQHIENFDENHPLYQLLIHPVFNLDHAKHILENVLYDHEKISNAIEALRKIHQEVNKR